MKENDMSKQRVGQTIKITTEAESKEHGLPIGTWTLREEREILKPRPGQTWHNAAGEVLILAVFVECGGETGIAYAAPSGLVRTTLSEFVTTFDPAPSSQAGGAA